jgi:hypothetical protein
LMCMTEKARRGWHWLASGGDTIIVEQFRG